MPNQPDAQIIIDTRFVTLVVYRDLKIVHHTFHKFVEGEQFRQALHAGVDELKRCGGHKWLSDDRNNSALPQADVTWAQSVWFPQAIAAGWKHWALLMPQNIVGQMNMRRFTEPYAKSGLTVRVFDETERALTWLKAQ